MVAMVFAAPEKLIRSISIGKFPTFDDVHWMLAMGEPLRLLTIAPALGDVTAIVDCVAVAETVTVAEEDDDPPGPLQTSVYVVVWVG